VHPVPETSGEDLLAMRNLTSARARARRCIVRKRTALFAAAALGAAFMPALALANLAGSTFESDDGNLVVNTAGNQDWVNAPNRVTGVEAFSGALDNSFGQGTKEDDTTPTVVTGSIPPQKSNLTRFYVANEKAANDHQYLYLAWERTNTLGSANMDFEINKLAQPDLTTTGTKTVNRSEGDLLVRYDFSGGGTTPTLSLVKWLTVGGGGVAGDCTANNALPCWGAKPTDDAIDGVNDNQIDLSAAGFADGAINAVTVTDPIPDPDVSLPPATFGEAAIDLTASGVFPAGTCVNFGSAYLKSRSSASFTAETKDFVAPQTLSINNCAQVIIRKQTDPDENPNTTSFSYTKAFATSPASGNTFSLTDDGVQTYTAFVGSGLTVTEDLANLPSGWDFVNVDCSASTGVDPSINGALVTFDLNDSEDVLDCTYTNRARGTITVIKQTADGNGAFDFTSTTLSPAAFTLTTTAPGQAGQDSRLFDDLAPGTYDVDETVPANWNLDSATCDDSSPVSAISLQPGEDITCTFVDSRERGAIDITKLRKHAADGPGNHPHAGVTFTVTGGELPAGGVDVVTDANGNACLSGLVVSALAGTYTVTEHVPAGYHNVDADGATRTGVPVTESTCASSATALSFHNMPLTDITMSVNSQVDGGTSSTIDCTPLDPAGDDATTGANGDGSHTVSDLEPGTYTCEVVIDP
jgi:hypothetical protein